jgi:hypothetical protein
VGRWNVGRIDNDAIDPRSSERFVDPKAKATCLVDAMILSAGKVVVKIVDQYVWFRRLGKTAMIISTEVNADLPTLLGNVEANIHVLVSKAQH